MIAAVRRHSGIYVLLSVVTMSVALFVACGQQQGPSLALENPQGLRGESEGVTGKSLAAVKASSAEGESAPEPIKLQVFAKSIEPLTLQRGGSVKLAIPLADQIASAGLIKTVEFQSAGDALKGSVVQGRTLTLVIGEDAVDGHYEGRIVVKLNNGREASQPVSVTVIP